MQEGLYVLQHQLDPESYARLVEEEAEVDSKHFDESEIQRFLKTDDLDIEPVQIKAKYLRLARDQEAKLKKEEGILETWMVDNYVFVHPIEILANSSGLLPGFRSQT